MLKIHQPNFVQAAGPVNSQIPLQNQAYNENSFNVTSSNGDIKWATVSYLPSPTGYLINIGINGQFNDNNVFYNIMIDLNSSFYNRYIKYNVGTSLVGSFTTSNKDVAYNASYDDNGNWSYPYWMAEWLNDNTQLGLTFHPNNINISDTYYELNFIIQ